MFSSICLQITAGKVAGSVPLEDEAFYHGYMTREEAEKLLTKPGEFLVRKAEVKGEEVGFIS